MIGFVFNFGNEKILVFIETIESKRDCIIGFENKLEKTNKTYLFSKDLALSEFKRKNSYPYSKISIGEINVKDSIDNIFWFKPLQFRELKQVLTIEEDKNLEMEIKIRCSDLYTFFK